MKLRTLIPSFLLFFICLFFILPSAHAESKVTSDVAITYTIANSGNTHVSAHITLTNTTDTFYVASYSLKLGFGTVSSVQASDPGGPITPVVKQTDAGQEITIPFNTIAAGKGKKLAFALSFDTPDIATQNGSIWEVNIPGLSSQTDFQSFTVDVVVPPSFGKPTFIKPDVGTTLHFTKDMLGKSGISLAFGTSQTYSYALTYNLENTNVFPIRTEIALPPTTNYQDVSLQSLSPKPDNVTLDTDGNWLAQYTLSPSQKTTINAAGLITVFLTPKVTAISSKERAIYLEKQSYWQVDNTQIQTLAKSLKTPEAIYDYVVAHLTYDFNRVKNDQVRVGAAGILQDPSSAVCLEFTDLFIALARAAGIPAREIDGFAYTQNTISRPLSLAKDVLHAWPEYYDDNRHTWVMVDPTWGNTTGGVDYFHTLDFDHVAFVVKGTSSTFPVPAGGYKFARNENEKDVNVNVTQEKITDVPTISMNVTFPQTVMSGLPVNGTVLLDNTGSVLFPVEPMHITTSLAPSQQFVNTPAIPPFGHVTQNISFAKTPLLTNTHADITIALAGKTIQSSVAIAAITKQFLIIGGIILALSIATIWLITTRPWRL